MISASEVANIIETAHLLLSAKNRRRLLAALNRAQSRKSQIQSRRMRLRTPKEIGNYFVCNKSGNQSFALTSPNSLSNGEGD